MHNSIYFLLVLTLLSCSNTLDSKNESSSQVVQKIKIDSQVAVDFVNQYIHRDFSVDSEEWCKSSGITTENFNKELNRILTEAEKESLGYGLGFDPIINGQDFPDDGFQVNSLDDKTGYAVINGIGWEDFKISVKLILQNGKTLVDGCGIVNISKELLFD